MTIKQNGGIFGRNPTFNDVETDGTLTVTGQSTFNSNITVQNDVNPKISILDSNGGFNAASFLVENGGRDLAIFAQQDIIIDSNSGELARFLKDGGLTFNGDTANSNALDDYEQGTWTPTYVPASGSFSSVNYDPNTDGRYTKIGNTVYVSGSLRTDSISVGTASGQVFIGGLPFSVGAYNYDGGGFTVFQSNLFTGEEPASASPTPSGTTAALLYRTAADGPLTSETQVGDLGTGANNNILRFFGFYFV